MLESKKTLNEWYIQLALQILGWSLALFSLYRILQIIGGKRAGQNPVHYIMLLIFAVVGIVYCFVWQSKMSGNTLVANKQTKVSNGFSYAALICALIVALFPVFWMIFASFLPSQRVMQIPPVFGFTSESSIENYAKITNRPEYIRFFINSFITAGGTVITVMIVAIPAAFAFSRYKFKGKSVIMTAIMSVQMFPIVVILISLYGFYFKWKLINTYAGVILADTVQALPLAIMLLKSFFDTLPKSLDESALIDGAGRFRIMLGILMPLVLPGLVAVGIYTFLTAWDDYLMALTIMTSTEMKTLTVGLAQSFFGEYAHDYGALMAFSMIGSLPVVLLFIFFQKYMISGLTQGSVKG